MAEGRQQVPTAAGENARADAGGSYEESSSTEQGQGTVTALVGSIQKFSVEDGPGIRTTVFLKGCPLACRWCHNPELIDPDQQPMASPANCIGCGACIRACPNGALAPRPEGGVAIDRARCTAQLACTVQCYAQAIRPVAKAMTVEEVLRVVEQDKGFYDNTGGGLTISGGEVLMHADFARCLVAAAGQRGIRSCIDTSGVGSPQVLLELACDPNVTDVLYDLKSVADDVHRAYTGVGNAVVLDNLALLAGDDRALGKLTVRMPLIADVNDSDDQIRGAGELLCRLGIRRVTLLPYHDFGVAKARNLGGCQETFRAPSSERIAQILHYFRTLHLQPELFGPEQET